MDERVAVLGCATIYLPVIFDICYDAYGTTDFHIHKNIEVDSEIDMPVISTEYSLTIFEPNKATTKLDKKVVYGVNGPFAKFNVFNHFKKKYAIEKDDYLALRHPSSIVAPSSSIGNGVLLEPAVVISSQTIVNFGVTIKRQVCVGHHCEIGEYAEINPGVTISGHVKIGRGAIIGCGSVIRNGVTIGENSFIGMGSVVTKDIPSGVVAFGSPCKVIGVNKKQHI